MTTAVLTQEAQVVQLPTAEIDAEIGVLTTAFETGDTNTIIMFATDKQKESTAIAESMLEGVRNKDLGNVGDGLNKIALTIKGFDSSVLNKDKPGFIGRLLGKLEPVALWLQSYEKVESQINAIVDKLNTDQHQLMVDVEKLDRMFNAQMDHFYGLDVSIEAGKIFLGKLNSEVLPVMKKEAEESDDPLAASVYQDKVDFRDKIERKVADLQLTREIIRQNLPAIRMTQQSDSGLVEKIETVKINTIPLWKKQMAILVAAARTKAAAEGVNAVTDVTNDLLKSGSELVRDANVKAREALERGIVSIETIEYANNQLLGMIEDTQKIYNEAKAARADAETRMKGAEEKLNQALLAM